MRYGDKILYRYQIVKFADKVFEPPLAPYFDKYKGETFRIINFHHDETHVEVECISNGNIRVDGYVHPDDIEVIF